MVPAPKLSPAKTSTVASPSLLVSAEAIGISPTVVVKLTITGALIPLIVAIALAGFEEVTVLVALPSASTKATVILMSPTTFISSPWVVKPKGVVELSPDDIEADISLAPLTLPAVNVIVAMPLSLVNAVPDVGENEPNPVSKVTERPTTGVVPCITVAVTVAGSAPVTVVSEIAKEIVIASGVLPSLPSVVSSNPPLLPPQPTKVANSKIKLKR